MPSRCDIGVQFGGGDTTFAASGRRGGPGAASAGYPGSGIRDEGPLCGCRSICIFMQDGHRGAGPFAGAEIFHPEPHLVDPSLPPLNKIEKCAIISAIKEDREWHGKTARLHELMRPSASGIF